MAIEARSITGRSDAHASLAAEASDAGQSPAPSDERLVPPSDVAAPPPDAKLTRSGLYYEVLKQGRGREHPRRDGVVEVEFTGWTTAGEMFNTTIGRPRPSELPVSELIPGWREALMTMTVGERRRLWIPEVLTMQGKAGLPRGMLVFDLELLEFENERPGNTQRERAEGKREGGR